jgi:hypothetical protein
MWEVEEEDFAVMFVEQFSLVDFDKLETFFLKKNLEIKCEDKSIVNHDYKYFFSLIHKTHRNIAEQKRAENK